MAPVRGVLAIRAAADLAGTKPEVARQAIREKTLLLEKMNQLLANSKLTASDIQKHASQINKRVFRKHEAA